MNSVGRSHFDSYEEMYVAYFDTHTAEDATNEVSERHTVLLDLDIGPKGRHVIKGHVCAEQSRRHWASILPPTHEP